MHDPLENEHKKGSSSFALDFANTVACRGCRVGDALATEAGALRWLKRHGLYVGPSQGPVPLAELRRLRTAIRTVFASSTPGSTHAPLETVLLNQASRLSPTYPTLVWAGKERVRVNVPLSAGKNLLLATLATSAISVVTNGGKYGVTQCAGPRCEHFLLARTSRQLWCSPTGCGNRARAARHYHRMKRTRVPVRD